MSPMVVAWIAFGCIFSGSILGMFLRSRLPESHLTSDSKDVIKLTMGVLGTMAALVLALLINSAKSSFDTQSHEITQAAADFILLDRVLTRYGPGTADARQLLRSTLATGIEQIWPQTSGPIKWNSAAGMPVSAKFLEKIQELKPSDDYQRSLQAQAIQIIAEITRIHSLLLEQTQGAIPMPFLVVLIFWLSVIFTGFGLFAPANPTVIGVLLLSSLSIAGAIFLVLELDRPFEGLLQVSNLPLRSALIHLGK
jgi:hypothetical protein